MALGSAIPSGLRAFHSFRPAMRARDRILENLESAYREQYDRAQAERLPRRMEELDAGYVRDQLMLEVLLDIRDLLAAPPPPPSQPS
jgi:hypothetical protein